MFENEHLVRQVDLIPPDKQGIGITVIGAGAIGSFATLALVKSGYYNVKVFDFDVVSIENMSCQGYRKKDIGKPKVEALAEIVKEFTEVDIEVVNKKWEPSYQENAIVIVAVDSMEARRTIFETIKGKCLSVKYMIDPRMGAEVAAMYCVAPHVQADAENYNNTLYSDADAVAERCTAKATNYTANMLAGLVVKCVKNLSLGQAYPRTVLWDIAKDDMTSFQGGK